MKIKKTGKKASGTHVRWAISKIYMRSSASPYPGELDRAHLTMVMKFPVRRRKGGAS